MKHLLEILHKRFLVEKKGKSIVLTDVENDSDLIQFDMLTGNSESQLVRRGENFFAKIAGHHLSGTFKQLKTDDSVITDFDGVVRSPFSGRVTKIDVSKGDHVDANHMLIIVEAMKMEYQVVTPKAGMVEDLMVSVGDQVVRDEVVARINVKGKG